MTIDQAIIKLAAALQKATNEHGRPNTFGPRELEAYGGPPAMLAGRIGSDRDALVVLWVKLGGRKGWGSCPRYDKRRFAV